MKKQILVLLCVALGAFSFAQNADYKRLVKTADSLYNAKNWAASVQNFSAAFKANGWKANTGDRYNAACSWALAGEKDSAFYHLFYLAEKSGYKNASHISTDTDLDGLKNDPRWPVFVQKVAQNKERAEVNLDKKLVAQLDTIYQLDQGVRSNYREMRAKYSQDSPELKAFWQKMSDVDSVNQIAVLSILEKHGWAGSDIVGEEGATTLWLVVQHSDVKIQEKYLPSMRDAVKRGVAKGSQLALLEDRVLMHNNKPQLYGSQYQCSDKCAFFEIADIENVDKRRAEVGLPPLREYAARNGLELPAGYK